MLAFLRQAKFRLTEDPAANVWYPTPLTKLQHLKSITLFFPEAVAGDDVSTKITYIGMRGTATSIKTTNKAVVGVNYEIRPQAKVNNIGVSNAAVS